MILLKICQPPNLFPVKFSAHTVTMWIKPAMTTSQQSSAGFYILILCVVYRTIFYYSVEILWAAYTVIDNLDNLWTLRVLLFTSRIVSVQ